MTFDEKHKYFMKEALIEASKAYSNGDVPVGAVVIYNNEVVGRGFNKVEIDQDSTNHAEMIAIKSAIATIGSKYLNDCSIYVTLEPCPMCSGAIVLSRIPFLIYGIDDSKFGASGTLYEITNDAKLNHRCKIIRGVLEEECKNLMKAFFHNLRVSKIGKS